MNGKKVALIVVVIVVLAGGGYALAKHNNNKNSSSSSNSYNYGSSSTQSSTSSTNSSGSTPAVNNAVLVTKTDSKVGSYLATPAGAALYTYGGDSNGVSNCTGSCLANWPAYEATTTTNLPTNVGTIKRSDNGKSQYTYKGMPLYTFVSDSNGQVTGDGVENFHVAKP
ncbi:MAG TPA: hypothetical protein VLG27_03970 [Candidatus Saccharimonadia bacterium]|nr:hypothetical protein [Candidatus Saccharimonadia bacterium]